MANSQQTKRKFIPIGRQKVGDLAKVVPDIGRWKLGKQIFGSQINSMFLINCIAVIMLLPVLYFIFKSVMDANYVGQLLPYSSAIGVGYPAIVDVGEIAHAEKMRVFVYDVVRFIPLLSIVSGFLIIGVFYAMRDMVWTKNLFEFKKMFRAYKFNWKQGILLSIILGVMVLAAMVVTWALKEFVFINGITFWSVTLIVLACLVGVIAVMFMLYMYAMMITYDMRFRDMVQLSLSFTFRFFIVNLLIIALMAIPAFVYLLLPLLSTFILMLYLFVGVSYAVLCWTVYSQYIFDGIVAANNAMKKKGKMN